MKKEKVIWHIAGNEDQPVSRFQIPRVPGLSSKIHVAQGTEMFPIIKADKTIMPTNVFVAMTRSRRSSKCLIEPSDSFDFSIFGKGTPLNPKSELLLAYLRGDKDFEEQLVEYHSKTRPSSPLEADPKSISSSRTLAGQSGDRKRKRQGGENGDHQRKGGDHSQQQAPGEPATSRTSARRGGKADEPATSRTSATRGNAGREGRATVRAGEPAGDRAG